MKTIFLTLITLLTILFISGCYHAQVTTGLEPSAQVYDKPFATSWIYGLVPPSVVRAQDECNNGVARVETRLSFVNMLVGQLTLGIFTPMHIRVTCAASSADIPAEESNTITVNRSDSEQIIQQAFKTAADQTVTSKKPVYIAFK
ncbi:MAG: hypothetical protein WD607_05420 [Candidatus Paceibacterota bacterium]